MKDFRTRKENHDFSFHEEYYSSKELSALDVIDDHNILLNYKTFLENSFHNLVKICMHSQLSAAWDIFTEQNFNLMVYGGFELKYKTTIPSCAPKYGFHHQSYKKISHIECDIIGDEIEVLASDLESKLKINAKAIIHIGIAFTQFYPEITVEDNITLTHKYIEAKIFDRKTGYVFDEKLYQTIYIPINQAVKFELVLEDDGGNDNELLPEKSVMIFESVAYKSKLIELISDKAG